jgi:hypothetical protein
VTLPADLFPFLFIALCTAVGLIGMYLTREKP